jgi:hypothetical protein
MRYISAPPTVHVGTLTSQGATMNWKAKLGLGILTALAMSALTLTLPHNTPQQNAIVTQFPMTVGIWAIFVLLFVKLK